MKPRLPRAPGSGDQIAVRVLQFGCVALVVAMALNAPSPNGQGGWRDQFMEGWREARSADQAPPAPTVPTVPGCSDSRWLREVRASEAPSCCGGVGAVHGLRHPRHPRGVAPPARPTSTPEAIPECADLDGDTTVPIRRPRRGAVMAARIRFVAFGAFALAVSAYFISQSEAGIERLVRSLGL